MQLHYNSGYLMLQNWHILPVLSVFRLTPCQHYHCGIAQYQPYLDPNIVYSLLSEYSVATCMSTLPQTLLTEPQTLLTGSEAAKDGLPSKSVTRGATC